MAKFEHDNVLQLDAILKEADKYEEIVIHTLKNGEDMEFYPYFSRTKIREILEEYQGYASSENKDDKKFMEAVTKDEFSMILFWYFLAVRKFTHFGVQMKRIKTVRGLIPYYNALLETGLLEEIVNDAFIFDELQKITNMFASESAIMIAGLEFINKFEETLDNKREDFKNVTLQSTQSE